MRRVLRACVIAAAIGAMAVPQRALAGSLPTAPHSERGRATVKWTRIDVPAGDDQARLAKLLRKLLDKAVKKADFGEVRAVSASVRVAEMKAEERDGVLRVSCTLIGKIEGGRSAKARISFGGDPGKAKELELDVLTMVANGLVTRLAELAHVRSKTSE